MIAVRPFLPPLETWLVLGSLLWLAWNFVRAMWKEGD